MWPWGEHNVHGRPFLPHSLEGEADLWAPAHGHQAHEFLGAHGHNCIDFLEKHLKTVSLGRMCVFPVLMLGVIPE